MSVKIKLNSAGQLVTPFQGNPEFGFIVLNSEELVFQNGWMQKKERSTLLRGATAMLQQAFASVRELPGRIAVTECLESEIPVKFSNQFNKSQTLEENIAGFIKRAGDESAPVLTFGGQRILRFTEYDASGTQVDIRIAHDNSDAVKAYNTAKAVAGANLPK